MPKTSHEIAIKAHALKLILFQLMFVSAIVALTFFLTDIHATRSAAMGGMIFLVPQYIHTRLSFWYVGFQHLAKTNTLMIIGNICKFALICMLFSAALSLPDIVNFNLFMTFVIAMFSQLFSLLLPLPEQPEEKQEKEAEIEQT